MKRIVSAGLVLATMSGAAFAADLPARTAPPVYAPPPIPVFTWTGAYFGINAGYAFDHEGHFDTVGNTAVNTGVIDGTRPSPFGVSSDGFTGGGQIGYNFQIPGFGANGSGGGLVFGVEADAAYTDLDRTRTFISAGGAPSTFRSSLDFLGTVRGRVGYAFGQFLIYGTGGYAYGGVNDRVSFNLPDGTQLFGGARDRIESGFAYGGGIEYALPTNSFLNFFKSSAVTLKAEYLHYDLGRSTFVLNPVNGGVGSYNTRVSNDGDLARIGLNYKFGSY